MVVDATVIFNHYRDEHRLVLEQSYELCHTAHMVHSIEVLKHLNESKSLLIILSASGMASYGSVVYHLKAFAPNPNYSFICWVSGSENTQLCHARQRGEH